jgi:subtilisin-like proprotein convertase family protein/plastocyanin
MKKILLYVLCTSPFLIFSQSFIMNQDDSISSCTGILFDSGLDTAGYQNNESFEYTVCPTGNGLKTEVEFQDFFLGQGDTLCIYDGSSVNTGTSIGCYTGNQILSGAIFTSNDGCLTFTFSSDTANPGAGWNMSLACANCQKITPNVVTDPSYNTATNYLDICPGDTVHFTPATNYPENNTNYSQNDSSSTFEYSIAGQLFMTDNFTFIFNNSGYYPLIMEVTDLNGCKAQRDVMAVRVSGRPSFAGTLITAPEGLCVNDTLLLSGTAEIPYVSYNYSNLGDPIFLPDGDGDSYSTTLNIGSFPIGQTLNSISDLLSICVNMEHTYLGDLEIEIICPNGSSAVLEQYPGGGSTFLGEAIDDGGPDPGVGWDYCWEDVNTNGTMDDYVTANFGFGGDTLPAGSYQSAESFSNLIGCPLNGSWELVITDNLLSDNGFIFGWSVNFNPSLYPEEIGFQNQVLDSWWQNPAEDSIGKDTITYFVFQNGPNPFTYSITDNFGCTFDTTIIINASPSPLANFDVDNECTNTQPFTFTNTSVANTSLSSIIWTFGDGDTSFVNSPTHSYETIGEYTVNLAIINNGGCADDTTAKVKLFAAPTSAFEQSVQVLCDSLQINRPIPLPIYGL